MNSIIVNIKSKHDILYSIYNAWKITEIDGDNQQRPYLPEELVLENIVVRLPARDLRRWSCVSKYWHNASIFNDSRFASSHFEHNKYKLNLVFTLFNVWIHDRCKCYILRVEEEVNKDNGFLRMLMDISGNAYRELVGYCNGLVCIKTVGNPTDERGILSIINHTRSEMFTLIYAVPTSCAHLCQGFCFDSVSQQYKVVIVYTAESAGDQEFVCMVLALPGGATNSFAWTKSVTGTAQIAPPFPGRVVTRCSMATRRSATLCGGDLVWRVTNCTGDNDDNEKIDMLLSFDIHEEKVRFVSLPTECSLTGTTMATRDEHQCLVIDHHLLEYRGYLCVAHSEKIMTHRSRRHRHRCHRSHPRIGQRRGFCCCGFKVHLFVLKDKVNQVWTKEETFDLQMKEKLPAPFCCYFDTIDATTLPLRILSFADQLLLYWSDGEYLLLYNLQTKHLKVVKCIGRRMHLVDGDVFAAKMKNRIRPGHGIGGDDKFPYMDYQLHAQAENIVSLKSFIPQGGEARRFYSTWEFEQSIKEPVGVLITPGDLIRCHAFY